MSREIDGAYISEVLDKLTEAPTAQNLDFLVSAHAQIGYYAAVAQSDADMAKAEREYAEAESFSKHKQADIKATAAQLEAYATIESMAHRRAEIKAATSAKKLTNLWDSVRQAIDAVKFLGKYEGPIGFGSQ